MAKPIQFGEYRPDVSALNEAHSSSMLNVVPRGDGYGPWPSPAVLTAALPSACRGYFYGRIGDEIVIFAGTATNLYRLDNSTLTWTNVSLGGGPYSDIPADGQWQFAQYNNKIIAVHVNTVPQVYDVLSSTAFANLGGTPPQARYISVIGSFVILSGLLDNPYRVHWSGIDNVTQWTAGVELCDYQDLADGGMVRGVVGGEFGIIVQDSALRRMVYVPGSEVIFQIERIARDVGSIAPYSIVNASDRMFFLSSRGFIMADLSGAVTPIGKERVDRTFLNGYDASELQLVIGSSDPASNTVIWASKSVDGGTTGLFDKIWLYDWVLNRWTPASVSGEYIAFLGAPGYTLESLDYIAPGVIDISGAANNGSGLIRLTVSSSSGWSTGDVKTVQGVLGTTEANGTWTITVIDATHIDLQSSTFSNAYTSGGIVSGSIDALAASLDTFAASALPKLSCVNSSHQICIFNGDPLEAIIETAEFSPVDRRAFLNSVTILTDSADAYASVGSRDHPSQAFTYLAEEEMDDEGYVPLLGEGRWMRVKVRIPAASDWTFITSLSPDIAVTGKE